MFNTGRTRPLEDCMVDVVEFDYALTKASHYVRMSQLFLRQPHTRGESGGHTLEPHFQKVGRTLRYILRDLDIWLEQCRVRRGQYPVPSECTVIYRRSPEYSEER